MKQMFSVRLLILSVVATFCLTPSAFGAVDYFLKIEGVKGESRYEPGAVDILAWSWGMSQSGSYRRKGPTASLQDFTVMKPLDKSSPKLAEACATGQVIPSMVLKCVSTETPDVPLFTITLRDVLVSSYSASSGNDGAVDSFTISCRSMTYSVAVAGGPPAEFIWDIPPPK